MKPTPLLLIGAGGFARETVELVRAINRRAETWRLLGLLDDDPLLHGTRILDVPVLGSCEAVDDHPEARVTACVASPARPGGRLALVRRLGLAPERFATLVHPAATIPESAVMGRGSVVHATTVLTADIVLGAHVAVMPAVVLTHDDLVGDGVTFGAGVRVAGGVTIEDGAYLGSGALLRENLTIGKESIIGMGAVVTQSVPAGETWAGVPARRLHAAPAPASV